MNEGEQILFVCICVYMHCEVIALCHSGLWLIVILRSSRCQSLQWPVLSFRQRAMATINQEILSISCYLLATIKINFRSYLNAKRAHTRASWKTGKQCVMCIALWWLDDLPLM